MSTNPPDLPGLSAFSERLFQRLDEGRYRFTLDALGIAFTIDRLRRRFDELTGELTVCCDLPGARTSGDNVLSVADFNLSSLRTREERARYLASRAQAQDIDWAGQLEEFVQRVQRAERTGQPAVLLRTVPRPPPEETIEIEGFPLIVRHPTILFGDGGTFKSYLGLYLAGRLEQLGVRTVIFDWELDAPDHRERLERLFGSDMPSVRYVRCSRPLVHEVDRLRRIVRDDEIGFTLYDSVAFACDGPPEAVEVAGRYFQCVRQVGGGSLHFAHVSHAEGSDQKPFGSTFWHNGARSTWNIKLAETVPGTNQIRESRPLSPQGEHGRLASGGGARDYV